MNDKLELINSLDELSKELRKNGKVGPATFFSEILEILRTSLDNEELKEASNKLIGCYSIAQYGDFSLQEEAMLSDVINFCKEYLSRYIK